MYLFRNAMRNLWRAKGRNLLILIIVVVIATASCVSLCIQQAAESARTEGLEALSVTAQISIDRQKMMENMGGGFQPGTDGQRPDRSEMFDKMGQSLTLDEYITYAESDLVKGYTYQISSSLNGNDDLEPMDLTGNADQETDDSDAANNAKPEQGQFPGMPGGGFNRDFAGRGQQGDFSVIGVSDKSHMTDFVNGTSTIEDGELFLFDADSDGCLSHQDLATLNGLEVGDSITLINPNNEAETITLKVTGLYASTQTTDDTQMQFSAAGDMANRIYMSEGKLTALLEDSEENATTQTDEETGATSSTALRSSLSFRYQFENIENYEAFCEAVYDMGLSEDYTVSSSDIASFEQQLVPLENLSRFAGIALLVFLGVGGIVLVVLNLFHIRERKYEMGVYTAIGMRKSKVATQFITELFAVTLAGVLLGSLIGATVSVPVSNALLESQVASSQSAGNQFMQQPGGKPQGGQMGGDMPSGGAPQMPENIGDFFGQMGGGMVDYISTVNAAVSWTVLLELMGIALLLTLISSLAAVISVLRYEPLKILSDRN